MSYSELMELALRELRVVAERSGAQVESRSAAGVHAARTIDGAAAYLKVTPTSAGPQALAAARRELSFYRELAPLAPVRTPPLLDALDTREGVALLLASAGEAQVAASWTPGMWADLGRDLAALHSMPLPTTAGWSRPDALLEALTAPNLEEINSFWAASLPRLSDVLVHRAELQGRISALPPVYIHGDCHTDNIVHAAGSLGFCDWQVAGIGRPVSDLALLSVRATPSGTAVPRVLIDAYLENRPHDSIALKRALVAEELAVFVFLWPRFAAFNSSAGIARVRSRARGLADRYFGETVHGRGSRRGPGL